MFCPSCGNKCAEGTKFCSFCGHTFSAAAPSGEAPQAPSGNSFTPGYQPQLSGHPAQPSGSQAQPSGYQPQLSGHPAQPSGYQAPPYDYQSMPAADYLYTEPKKSNSAPLILGIVGLVLNVLLGCCCTCFGVLPGIVCSVIGLVLAAKARKEYAPGEKDKNVETGFILCIIGLVIGILILITCGVLYLFGFGLSFAEYMDYL